MLCNRLTVQNFRNIAAADVTFSPGTNLLLGDNAQGKTNLLEAISLIALGKSFRGAKDADMIRFGQREASLSLDYSDELREQNISIFLEEGKRRRTEQNGNRIAKASEMVGVFRVVLFCPEHLSLIKSGPELRRNFLDVALCQLRPMYLRSLQRYGKILKERNRLLKDAGEHPAGMKNFKETIDLWSIQLAHEAAIIARYRARYVRSMNRAAAQVFHDMTDGREIPEFLYCGSAGTDADAYEDLAATEKTYLDLLSTSHAREIGAGFTLWGTHRDDVEILLNGRAARIFASQGQQRSLSLAMKLAEGEISRADVGEYPVFLFDDVLSELDSARREYLVSKIKDKQVIMTTCEKEETLRFPEAKIIKVSDGSFEEKE